MKEYVIIERTIKNENGKETYLEKRVGVLRIHPRWYIRVPWKLSDYIIGIYGFILLGLSLHFNNIPSAIVGITCLFLSSIDSIKELEKK